MAARILHLDIETAPNLVYAWGLWRQNIAISQIVEPGYTLCWAAKWHGERKVHFASFHEPDMIEKIHALLSEADIAVHYNGNKFDIPKLQMEFLLSGLEPTSQTRHVDLLPVVRRQFGFTSNKLDYVAQQLGLGAKTQHKGMEMWHSCMDPNHPDHERAWKVMKRYNIQDVRLLENVYKRLLPWIPTHPNVSLYIDSDEPLCRNCGSENLRKEGLSYTNAGIYQQYQCKDCGKWGRGNKTMKPKSKAVIL